MPHPLQATLSHLELQSALFFSLPCLLLCVVHTLFFWRMHFDLCTCLDILFFLLSKFTQAPLFLRCFVDGTGFPCGACQCMQLSASAPSFLPDQETLGVSPSVPFCVLACNAAPGLEEAMAIRGSQQGQRLPQKSLLCTRPWTDALPQHPY